MTKTGTGTGGVTKTSGTVAVTGAGGLMALVLWLAPEMPQPVAGLVGGTLGSVLTPLLNGVVLRLQRWAQG